MVEPRQYLYGIEHRIKVIGSLVGPGFGAIGLSGVTTELSRFPPSEADVPARSRYVSF